MKGYIYAHINKQNNKAYVGQTIRELNIRFGNNGNNYKNNRNTLFYDAIQKYGWNNFQHKIIYTIECESKDDLLLALNNLEEQVILKYNSYNSEYGYNIECGGKNAIKSDVTKQKIKHTLKKDKSNIENILNRQNENNTQIINKTNFVDKKTILQYMKYKYIVCVDEIIENTINNNIEITKKERIQIVKILDSIENFERVSTVRFDKYGRQRGWRCISI